VFLCFNQCVGGCNTINLVLNVNNNKKTEVDKGLFEIVALKLLVFFCFARFAWNSFNKTNNFILKFAIEKCSKIIP